MKPHRLRSILRSSLCAPLLLALLLLFPPASHSPQPPNAQQPIPNTESPGWWGAVQDDIRSGEYRVTWQATPLFPGDSPGYQAPNRQQDLRIGFQSSGIYIVPRTPGPPRWMFGLALIGLGRQGAPTSISTPTLSVQENSVTYHRVSITERYTNKRTGLEQELRIPNTQPPTPSTQAPIALELSVSGDLVPHAAEVPPRGSGQGSYAVEFTTADGTPALQYTLLDATDAAGRQLPVHIELVSDLHASPRAHDALRITLGDAAAAYPVTVRARLTSPPSSASRPMELTQAWIGESNQDNASLGFALSTAGDVNGDGYSDLIVGAPWYDGGQANEGAVFVYHGSSTGPTVGSADWITESNQANAHFGHAVSIAGDVDGDGYADVIVGAPDYDAPPEEDAGAAFVYHGGSTGLGTGSADWVVTGGQEDAHFGYSVSTAGDLNDDGYTDVIVGAPGYDGDQADGGAAFAYHGGPTGLATGSADWTSVGDQSAAQLGTVVSTAGDVDGDGYADVVIGAPGYDISNTATLTDAGRAYIHYGSSTGLVTGTVSWTADGDQAGARLGAAASTAGDVNGDGRADVVIGAPGYDVVGTVNLTDVGRAYVYYGGSTTSKAAPTSRSPDWTATGGQENAHFGAAVSIAGDVNSDGYADIVVGAPDYDDIQPDEGAAFVYQGGPTGLATVPAWSAHPTDQENAHFGVAVSTAGDVDGDGHSDLAIGASGYDNQQTDEGGAFVYYGHPSGLAATPTWSAAGQQDGALAGWSVAAAGDVNGDGYADIIIGAPQYDRGQTEEGAAFLYTGGPDGPTTSPAWIGESDQAWAWFGQAVAGAGDVNNDGYADIIVGAPRYDGEQIDDGKAFVYHGSPAGLTAGPADWVAPPEGQGTVLFGISARFGLAVSSAGDVNGDGYADVIIGANGYDGEETNEGAAFVYHGGPRGLDIDFAWAAHPTDEAYANFGRSVSSAGDVNGDGYSDVIIGAPWVATSGIDEQLDGTAYVYHGSATGLGLSPNWTVTEVFANAEFGTAVSTAGDVNGDGYSDVIIGAYKHTEILHVTPWREGGAFIYHGSATGLAGPPDWAIRGGQRQIRFGISVSTAGDVNGDGYSDVIVGASSYADGQNNEGAAFVFHGGPTVGQTTLVASSADWFAQGEQEGAAYGFCVSTAGDVNGDGYGDVIVGAPTYNDVWTDEGAAFIYLGNDAGGSGGLPVSPIQLRSEGDGQVPIAPLGRSNSASQVRLQSIGRSPLGREAVALQRQVAPLGIPFTATASETVSGTGTSWSDALASGVVLSQTVDGLTGGIVYRWRVRTLYQPGNRLGQTAGRWLYLPWNSPQEADFRTPRLLTPDRSSTVVAGDVAVYAHKLTNPISETQAFTLIGVSSSGYPVTITTATPLGGPTATLPAFGWSPVTVSVKIPAAAISGTDTTVITAASSLSGYDVVRDVTTITAASDIAAKDVFLPLTLR